MNRNSLILEARQVAEIRLQRFFEECAQKGIAPFVGADCNVGMEYEMQVAVAGLPENVDLPRTLLQSNYYNNIRKRAERGELSKELVSSLTEFVYDNEENIWENSWVRFQQSMLSAGAAALLEHDLLADKEHPESGFRSDVHRYRSESGELHLPVSYLLRLALADAMECAALPADLAVLAESILDNFQSDNTSPEVLSFCIAQAGKRCIGDLAAEETALALLVMQLLVQYANMKFGLLASGQRVLIYFAPHAPQRQKQLNDQVPDAYYRHLFMSPCLSGWRRGEEKHQYMGLCHRTLSRSRLNTISKLKDAGILVNNLVTLPNTSNTCLANNGIHVSLGSKALTAMAKDPASWYTPEIEKQCGDLVIKIMEHFLPLFVGSYCAAPYRIDFKDFHPENVLGFLPHELDYTHLRMVWRRWRRKAKLKALGQTLTPFGPRWIDTVIAAVFRLKGDLVPDFRLIDYLVCLLSTENSPGLDGAEGNHERLKEELMEMGVYDTRMSMYLLYRQRVFACAGYAGFEGRSYSLFHSLQEEMAEAVRMQNFLTALAYRLILTRKVSHRDIPDNPSVESERRQIFFGSAIDIPTFYVRLDTENLFLKRIIERLPNVRRSNRYRSYLRVKNRSYRLGLLQIFREDHADLIAEMGMESTLQKLHDRLSGDAPSATTKIVDSVIRKQGRCRKPLQMKAVSFNMLAEKFCREELRKEHMQEGLDVLFRGCALFQEGVDAMELFSLQKGIGSPGEYVQAHKQAVLNETAEIDTVRNLLTIWLASLACRRREYSVS